MLHALDELFFMMTAYYRFSRVTNTSAAGKLLGIKLGFYNSSFSSFRYMLPHLSKLDSLGGMDL